MALDDLADRIQGGLLGQILGNLNGLPHEFKYLAEPGDVAAYTPALPEGARTDDDTDIEWLYVIEMQRSGRLLLAPERIAALWRGHVNAHVWCANRYARALMELGLEPPLTGRIALNPWSEFNISGQFLCEAFGLISPAMPQTAARIGLHYTHVGIDGEPAQATQLFTGMIATAFVEDDVGRIIEAGLANVDPGSVIHEVVRETRRLHGLAPDDWRATRRRIRDAYTRHGGTERDGNGHELNTAAIVAALLYGKGDFTETLRLAFNFGWDADCNAATAGTIVGVMRGRRWMDRQGWTIADRYRNTTRPGLPEDETITGYGRRLVELARRAIVENGGSERRVDGRVVMRVRRQRPGCVERLPVPADRREELRRELLPRIDAGLSGSSAERALAAYLAVCLDEASRLQSGRKDEWAAAVEALKSYKDVVKFMMQAPAPAGGPLRERARAAGVIP